MRLGSLGMRLGRPGNEVREPGDVHIKQMLVELEDEETMNDTP